MIIMMTTTKEAVT